MSEIIEISYTEFKKCNFYIYLDLFYNILYIKKYVHFSNIFLFILSITIKKETYVCDVDIRKILEFSERQINY